MNLNRVDQLSMNGCPSEHPFLFLKLNQLRPLPSLFLVNRAYRFVFAVSRYCKFICLAMLVKNGYFANYPNMKIMRR